jgi:3'(2'), 5'-bisphosphate nucleotidase
MLGEGMLKEDRSPVTVADFSIQALVAHRLEQAVPADRLVAEEDSQLLDDGDAGQDLLGKITAFLKYRVPTSTPEQARDWIRRGTQSPADRFWTLDPVDGTKGFLRGEQYAIALALIVSGEVEIGVLGCPNLGKTGLPEKGQGALWVAVRGEGCWAGLAGLGSGAFAQQKVSRTNNSAQARVFRSVEAAHTDVVAFDQLVEALQSEVPSVRMDSQAKYSSLAAGQGEVLFRLLSPQRRDYREKIWDQAAGSIVLEEAGGRITDLSGKPLDFGQGRRLENNVGVLASNGLLHEASLAALSKLDLA